MEELPLLPTELLSVPSRNSISHIPFSRQPPFSRGRIHILFIIFFNPPHFNATPIPQGQSHFQETFRLTTRPKTPYNTPIHSLEALPSPRSPCFACKRSPRVHTLAQRCRGRECNALGARNRVPAFPFSFSCSAKGAPRGFRACVSGAPNLRLCCDRRALDARSSPLKVRLA